MMHKTIMIVCCWSALCFICTCNRDFSTSPDPAAGYPTTLYPRSAEELDSLKAEYRMNNSAHLCPTLNEYGFPRWAVSCFPEKNDFVVSRIDSILKIAKAIVVHNSKLNNVYDTTSLKMKDYRITFRDWRIFFDYQKYNSLTVLNTMISVLGDKDGVFMLSGNWYNDIIIPEERYSLEKSKQQIIDDIGGHGFCDDQYNEKLIYPIDKSDSIELRVVWRIAVGTSPDTLYYFYYVDVFNGEVVKVAKLFF